MAPYNPIEPFYAERLQAPSANHLFGTDEVGRDLFSRVIHGARISLSVGIIILAIAVSIGTVLGTIAGIYGGLIDELIMRITDMFLSFPSLILAMAIAATLGASLENSLIALSIAWWPWYSRLVRGEVLRIREREFVLASQATGASKWHLVIEHLWPNILTPVLVQISMDFGYAILSTAGLSFIGLGAQPPSPEWGLMIWTGRTFIRESWWYVTFPGLALMTAVLGFNLVGDGLRDFLDPRVRRSDV